MKTIISEEVKKVIFEGFPDYLDRYKAGIVDDILNKVGRADYRSLYVEMCYKDMAKNDGIDLEGF